MNDERILQLTPLEEKSAMASCVQPANSLLAAIITIVVVCVAFTLLGPAA